MVVEGKRMGNHGGGMVVGSVDDGGQRRNSVITIIILNFNFNFNFNFPVTQAPPEREAMDCFQVAKKFGGIAIVDFPTTVKAPPLRRQLFEAHSLLSLLSGGAEGARRGLMNSGATVFDVTEYGAVADGEQECAQAFIQAFNAACKSNGAAKVVIPPGTYMSGEVFFQGPCTAPAPITVEVQGTVLAQTDLSEYVNGQWFAIQNIDGLVLEGGGTFDGRGNESWQYDDCGGKAACNSRLPPSLVFNKVNNSLLQGINLVNSKGFNMKICESYNFTAQGLNISAPWDSPNTDGIHISRSDLVTVSSSTIGTGDDCISIGEGSTNVSISGINCGPGHGISIGSLGKRPDEEDVKGIIVTNCTLSDTTNGARIKTWHQSPELQASNIVFENIVMNNVRNPIFIDQNYGSKNKPGSSNVKISDVHFKNIRGTTISNVAVSLNCSETVPCEGVELVDIDFKYTGKITAQDVILIAACENAKATFSGIQNISPCVV
ncbi:Exopolygalacturonase [Actinidia chinensis var. chinensis]|uniref:Exopolygalacturonase n=1 Tax=Actinidia chinensis var. chinensis TaxID=1590841 RepID=A0A2R6P5Q1_ACTCC|nr:Exopolygalacturonase [Actinidia chinensis var. chinensis]